VGLVSQVDRAACRARVRLPDQDDLESGWLQVLQQGTRGRSSNWVPELGEQVVCLLDERAEDGFVLGSVYVVSAEPPIGGDAMAWDDGTVVRYDRAARKLVIQVEGDVEVVVAGQVQLGANDLVASLDGVVTRQCKCAYTGIAHPDASRIVLAVKGGL